MHDSSNINETHIIICNFDASAHDSWMILNNSLSKLNAVADSWTEALQGFGALFIDDLPDMKFNGHIYYIDTIDGERYMFLDLIDFDMKSMDALPDYYETTRSDGTRIHGVDQFLKYIREYQIELRKYRMKARFVIQ